VKRCENDDEFSTKAQRTCWGEKDGREEFLLYFNCAAVVNASDNMVKNEALLWKRYVKDRDRETRNEIVINYLYLVKYVSSDIQHNLPRSIEVDDLFEQGVIGLIEAVENFDPSRNVKFETYASRRIKGEILDYLRSIDWLSRTLRKGIKKVEESYLRLITASGEIPSVSEVANDLNMSEKKVKKIIDNISLEQILSLDEYLFGKENIPWRDFIRSNTEEAEEEVTRERLQERLVEGIKRLPPREQLLLQLYYFEELNFREIGTILNISESRVSQIHAAVIMKLKAYLLGEENPWKREIGFDSPL